MNSSDGKAEFSAAITPVLMLDSLQNIPIC